MSHTKETDLNIPKDPDRIMYAAKDPIIIISKPRRGKQGKMRVEARTSVKRQIGKLYFIKNGDLFSTEAGRG